MAYRLIFSFVLLSLISWTRGHRNIRSEVSANLHTNPHNKNYNLYPDHLVFNSPGKKTHPKSHKTAASKGNSSAGEALAEAAKEAVANGKVVQGLKALSRNVEENEAAAEENHLEEERIKIAKAEKNEAENELHASQHHLNTVEEKDRHEEAMKKFEDEELQETEREKEEKMENKLNHLDVKRKELEDAEAIVNERAKETELLGEEKIEQAKKKEVHDLQHAIIKKINHK